MSEMVMQSSQLIASVPAPLPEPRVAIRVRVGTLDDLPLMDALQKKHSKQLGFFPRAQMEGYIRAGNVLVAEERHEGPEARRHEGEDGSAASSLHSVPSCPRASVPHLLGYVAFRDRYLKRDELGVIYQLCVAPAGQRKLVGATLIKEVFARSPYGCRLYCCWCAQDIAANRFWEALGFVPLAFRSGSRTKGPKGSPRVHIFWQKRIRGDATPWWYPSETGGGAIREDRLVLPMPAGVRWDEVMPVLLPTAGVLPGANAEVGRLTDERRMGTAHHSRTSRAITCGDGGRCPPSAPATRSARVPCRPDFSKPAVETAVAVTSAAVAPAEVTPTKKREPRKNDPALAKKARELRDRWLEHVNDVDVIAAPAGKYELISPAANPSRRDETTFIDVEPIKRLAA